MNPKVSVIIPAYNTENYIAQTLASALGQTLQNIEVIVVDDASTDRTVEIIKSFDDPRLKLLQHQQNKGAGAARNTALRAARGTWIAVLDSDDWFAKDRLEFLMELAEQQETEFIADDLYLVEDGSETPYGTLLEFSEESFQDIQFVSPIAFVETQRKNRLAYTKPVIRRSFLEHHQLAYDPSLRLGQDYWFYMQCFLKGARYLLASEPHYFYRVRSNSLVTQNSLQRFEGFYRTACEFLQYPEVQSNPEIARAIATNLVTYKHNCAYYRVVTPLKRREWKKALEQLIANPLFWVVAGPRLWPAIQRRWEYYIGRNANAFETRLWNKSKGTGQGKPSILG